MRLLIVKTSSMGDVVHALPALTDALRATSDAAGEYTFWAYQAGAWQKNNGLRIDHLLLSPQAVINARPQLEILTDDVQCRHGATTGTLDPNQFFYLLSRGIAPDAARALLTRAFCEDILAALPVPGLRAPVEELVVGRLPDRDLIRRLA